MVKMIGQSLKEQDKEEKKKKKYIFLEFNAWLYQGYDDARTALLHSVSEKLASEMKERKISYKFKSRNYTNKGYDYAIEFTAKELDVLKEELKTNKKVSKYSIIEYDADDIV